MEHLMAHRPKRIKLENFEIDLEPGLGCTGKVVLKWEPGDAYTGTADGDDSPRGHLRCSAEATAEALQLASGGAVDLDVLAIKAIEGFDTVLVIVAMRSDEAEISERLSGSCLIKGQPPRSAAMAVLDATNRLYGHALYTIESKDRKLH
jgi:hypothetical protein